MEEVKRLLRSRKISKFKRLGDADLHLHDVLQKPILTKRDKEVLLSIYYHRCLTTEQVAELHFQYDSKGQVNTQSSVIARRRLRKLFDYALIDRFFVDVGEGQGSSQAHMVLDSLGAKVIAGLLNMNLDDVNWRYDMNEARLPYLGHMVAVNNFHLYFLRSARQKGHEALDFRTENHIRHEFKYWGQRMVFNPDAYGQYWAGEEGFHYFLEWDNGTMTPLTYQKKHQRYTAFYDSDEYLKFYETYPVILTVTTTRERAAALSRVIREVDNTDKMWLFAASEDVRQNGVKTIWINKEGKPVTLLE
jgi:hypothetical protein